MFDFVNYTYSGILSIIAALIGLGLPLIIGRIEGIDERYKSTLLTKRFKQESSFTCYIVLTIANVIIAVVIPFVMDYSANARIWIAVQSGMLVLLLVNLYILLSDMLVYTNPIELQERILKDLHKHKMSIIWSMNSTPPSPPTTQIFPLSTVAPKPPNLIS